MRSDLPSGTITLLFTDIEGSTTLLCELGAEEYSRALATHRRLLREACARSSGVEVDSQGDAFFAAFPTAQGAIGAAQTVMLDLGSGPIRVRVGVHTGTCAPQKCRPAGATPDFGTSAFSVIRFSGPCSSLRERRQRPNRVLVVQVPQHGRRSHERTRCPSTSRFSLRGSCRSCGRAGYTWYTRSQCTVGTPAVVVSNPLAQDRAEMSLGHRNHPVQALAPYRADHALADRVRLRAGKR